MDKEDKSLELEIEKLLDDLEKSGDILCAKLRTRKSTYITAEINIDMMKAAFKSLKEHCKKIRDGL